MPRNSFSFQHMIILTCSAQLCFHFGTFSTKSFSVNRRLFRNRTVFFRVNLCPINYSNTTEISTLRRCFIAISVYSFSWLRCRCGFALLRVKKNGIILLAFRLSFKSFDLILFFFVLSPFRFRLFLANAAGCPALSHFGISTWHINQIQNRFPVTLKYDHILFFRLPNFTTI